MYVLPNLNRVNSGYNKIFLLLNWVSGDGEAYICMSVSMYVEAVTMWHFLLAMNSKMVE